MTAQVGHTPAVQASAPAGRAARRWASPEAGALVGAIAVYAFFFAVAPPFRDLASLASVLYVSSIYGIPALAVALLMIGGEFDLSAGVAVVSAALLASMLSFELTANVWAGVGLSLIAALAIGALNGLVVIRTGIPSFLVTLGTFFMLGGLNLAVTRLATGSVATHDISDMDGFAAARALFASSLAVGGIGLRVTVLWWLAFAGGAAWLLRRSRYGNWIFAVGGAPAAARAAGVPVRRVKVALFMGVGFAAWFVGMHQLFAFDTVQSGEGVGKEFYYIIAAVVGGCLLTGGAGSAWGAVLGALIFGMTTQGIVYAGWNPDWFKFFVGALLLIVILLNAGVRRWQALRR
ncbi:MAG TPA: ABC transporter permease [Phenylobacterium sp.]|uniref:ABC transporter permease n=1 Tax=Phenylobacterium sp. TaxID=1871053 RepID=UPI002C464598|nr:ABC transporter permease [Phenylobacterium sp.]HSV01902.1 ABC transporter permease [Phenylobacterium sp.]